MDKKLLEGLEQARLFLDAEAEGWLKIRGEKKAREEHLRPHQERLLNAAKLAGERLEAVKKEKGG